MSDTAANPQSSQAEIDKMQPISRSILNSAYTYNLHPCKHIQ